MARSFSPPAGAPDTDTSPTAPPPWWPTILAAAFVLACLLALAAIPLWTASRVETLRTEIHVVAEPTHPLAMRLRFLFARESAAVRGYLLTDDDTFRLRAREVRVRAEETLDQLEPLARRLDPALVGQVDAVRSLAGPWHALQDSLFAGRLTREQYLASFPAQRRLYNLLLDETERFDHALVRETDRRRAAIRSVERRNFVLSSLLAVAALGAALVVAWLARRERLFATENARLYRESTRAAKRWRFLAEASAILSAFLDYTRTLGSLARLSVPRIADWCIVDVFDAGAEDGVERVATAHVDPRKELLLDEMRRRQPLDSRSMQPAARAIRSGEPLLLPRVTPEYVEESTRDSEQVALLRELGVESLIAVPLVARGHTIGAMTFVSGAPDRPYDADDLELAVALAGRAALTVDNSRLYHAALAGNRAKANFLAVVSHELRTPLTAVLGYAELLDMELAGPLTEKQAEQLGRIRVSALHLLDLIDEILTFTRLEAAGEEVHAGPVDLAELVRDAVVVIEPGASDKGLSVRTELSEAPLEVETDRAKVRRILLNLLANAVKFTERGEIVLSARRDDGSVVVRVRDTGVGIAREQFEEIFEPFWQAEEANTRLVGGAGLGLSVARRLARLLGGEITLDSAPARGSTFTVRLPARAAEPG